eukprot:g2006.t1
MELGEDDEEELCQRRVLFSFGQNSYGELGHGDQVLRKVPMAVRFFEDKVPVQVAAGNEHTVVLCEDHSVFGCGYNDSGQLGLGDSVGNAFEMAECVALRDRRVVSVHASNGCEHLATLTDDGEMHVCGYNAKGQLGNDTRTSIPVPQRVEALFDRRVTHVACSYYHTVAIADESEVFSFGRNDYGQLGHGNTVDCLVPRRVQHLAGQAVHAAACGQYHTVLALSAGGAATMGKNEYGQLGISPGDPRKLPVSVLGSISTKQLVSVAAGYYHSCVLTREGTVYSFGRNDYGQLGVGSTHNHHKPVALRVSSLERPLGRIVGIAGGCYHTLVLDVNGRVAAFGRNNHGQLGIDSLEDQSLPVNVEVRDSRGRRAHVVQVAAGFYHSLCLTGPTRGALAAARAPRRSLPSDLRRLLNNEHRSDVCFVVQGRPVHAHRAIIMARCEPLACMLDGHFRESRLARVEMHDIAYDVFLAFLEYLYTGEVRALRQEQGQAQSAQVQGQGHDQEWFDASQDAAAVTEVSEAAIDVGFVLDLLAVADQFLVAILKRKCERAIKRGITVENVSFMLQTADERQARALRKKCAEYIIAHFNEVIATEAFASLPQALLHEILVTASQQQAAASPAVSRQEGDGASGVSMRRSRTDGHAPFASPVEPPRPPPPSMPPMTSTAASASAVGFNSDDSDSSESDPS